MSTIIDGSAGITTNAGGSVNPSTNIDGINYSCRAWVNFNGTGTVAIRSSGNVTNITDNGVGDYTVNITNALVDANYSVICTSSQNTTVGPNNASSLSTTAVSNVKTLNDAGVNVDRDLISVAISR